MNPNKNGNQGPGLQPAWARMARDALLFVTNSLFCSAPVFEGDVPENCVICPNHASHLDTLAVLGALPRAMRDATRPVAAMDYWGAGPVRRFVACRILNAVLLDRGAGRGALGPVERALAEGSRVILFPEGTRGSGAEPGRFRGGVFELSAGGFPVVPVFLSNLSRIMPRGAPVPLPLVCGARFGRAVVNDGAMDRAAFCERLRKLVGGLSDG